MTFAAILAFFILLCAIVLIFKAVRIVPQGEQWTIENFGRFVGILPPGLHFLVPIYQSVGRRVDVREQVYEVPRQGVITKDNAMVSVDGIVFFQIIDPALAVYEVQSIEDAISAMVTTTIRTTVGAMTLDEALSSRERMSTQILSSVESASEKWGVKVHRVEIRDINPPQSMVDSMSQEMTAERTRRALILSANGEKAAVVLKAEGVRDAAALEAEARVKLAEAEAQSLRLVADAVDQNKDGYGTNYFLSQKYIEMMGGLVSSPNQKTVIVPADFGPMTRLVAGLNEIKDATEGRR